MTDPTIERGADEVVAAPEPLIEGGPDEAPADTAGAGAPSREAAPELVELTARVAELEAQVAKTTAERDDLRSAYSRIAADFENHRRRTQREMESLVVTAAEGLILKLLPVVDNLERALLAVGTAGGDVDQGLAGGVSMTLQQLVGTLAQAGVEPIEAVGKPFDPQRNDAIMQVEDVSVPDQTVVEELQKGYLLKGKVIRPSMVKVARNQG